MTKKYEKFEEWMLGKKVTHVVVGSSGVIVERPAEDDPDACVRVKYDEGDLAGAALRAFLSNLEFLEEKPSEEVGAQESSQIDWEVGQVVWDVAYGKGEVVKVDESVYVKFKSDNTTYTFTADGSYDNEGSVRTLFFSEPVITAELFPPKKPFKPTLKKGDEVVTWFEDGRKYFTVVREETLTAVIDDNGVSFLKSETRFLKIGEEIKFQ